MPHDIVLHNTAVIRGYAQNVLISTPSKEQRDFHTIVHAKCPFSDEDKQLHRSWEGRHCVYLWIPVADVLSRTFAELLPQSTSS